MSSGRILGFDAFAAYIAEGMRFEPEALSFDALLDDDLGLDSFDMLEVLVRIEELGVHVPEETVKEVKTVGDLHRKYVTLAEDASTEKPATDQSSVAKPL